MYTKTAAASTNVDLRNIMKTILSIPVLDFMPSYIEALKEGHRCGGDKVKTPDEIAAITASPQAYLDKLLGPQPATFTDEKGQVFERVPDTPVWFMQGNVFIGNAKIRHRLTPALEASGGHIGYGIRPAYQGKGHATEMLRQCLVWARENLKVERVLLSCRADNPASARVMEKCGGQLLDETPHPYAAGIMQKRYWLPVPQRLILISTKG